MKKTILTCIALLAIFVTAQASAAAEYEVEANVWVNTWREKNEFDAGGSERFNNGNAALAGPSVAVRFPNRWFARGSYLASLGAYKSSDWIAPGDTMEFQFHRFDLRVGRMFQPRFFFRPDPPVKFGLFAGYRINTAPAFYTNTANGYDDSRIGTWKQEGLAFGALYEQQLKPALKLYGELEFSSLEQEFRFLNNASEPFSAHGIGYELGLSYAFNEGLAARFGVKYEQSSGEVESGDRDWNYFYGMNAGVLYVFR
jgi:hypothetical protein